MAAINLRHVDNKRHASMTRKAGARGWTLAKLVEKYDALHDAMRARADAGDDALRAELMTLGLETHSQ